MADFRNKWNSNDNQYQTEYNAFFASAGVYQAVGLNGATYGWGSYTPPTRPGMAQNLALHLDLWNPSWQELDQKQIESKQGATIRAVIEAPKGSGAFSLYSFRPPKNFQP